jgi:hypothetical protein
LPSNVGSYLGVLSSDTLAENSVKTNKYIFMNINEEKVNMKELNKAQAKEVSGGESPIVRAICDLWEHIQEIFDL